MIAKNSKIIYILEDATNIMFNWLDSEESNQNKNVCVRHFFEVNVEKHMRECLKEAKKAFEKNEIPVGAIIVKNNKVIAKNHNRKEKTKSIFDHAEMLCIKTAIKKSGDWRLNDCLLFVTLEPCLMCLGSIIECRIKKIYISASKQTYSEEIKKILKKEKIEVEYGLLKNESEILLKSFFKNKR